VVGSDPILLCSKLSLDAGDALLERGVLGESALGEVNTV
jgi:hypothetical protein